MEMRCAMRAVRRLGQTLEHRHSLPAAASAGTASASTLCCARLCVSRHQARYFNTTPQYQTLVKSRFLGSLAYLNSTPQYQRLVKSRFSGGLAPCPVALPCGSDMGKTGVLGGSVRGMAGHSKWANIRHIKAAKDTEKARTITDFTRKLRAFIRETGQTDPKTSSQLAKLLADAKSKNIPNANVDRVLTQMINLKNSAPVLFEAKGPQGSVMLIETLTAKRTQTRGEMQSIVKKCGFSLFEGGLARMTFEEKGMVTVSNPGETTPDLDSFVDVAIEAGAEDVTLEEDEEGATVLQFVCEPNDVYAVKKELEARQLPVMSAEVTFNCVSTVALETGTLELIAKAMYKLEEHPDVLKVYINVVEAS